ncbi:ABC transporter permease [Frankia gtarii]|uniref:ABC transporter permease n=1 Tax=Frankia gtarii TaxID=2950102 RepID=UPI0021BEA5E8|nr:ABC transporter permease [Frankia gtarii]
MRRSVSINLGLDRFSGLYLWAVFVIVFGVWTPDLFLTMSTVHSIASAQAITGMLGIAVLIPLACGTYDLSIGATVNISAVLAGSLQTGQHLGLWPAILVALVSAVLIGIANGFFVVVLGINSFIATLGMATVVGAFQAIATGNTQPNPPTGRTWNNLAQYSIGGFQVVVLFLLAIVLLAWWALDHTPAGRYLYAIGGNREAARLAGVHVDRWTWLSLVASSTICGIAGVLYSSLNGPSLTFGAALLLPAFAAAFLGSTQLTPGRFNVWGTVIAVFVLATGVQGLQFVTGVQWLSDMFNGVALLTAVGFAVWRQKTSKARLDRTPAPARDDSGPAPADIDAPPDAPVALSG